MMLDENFWQKVQAYEKILIKFNKIHSLTNYKDIKSVALDSVKIMDFLDFSEFKKAVDIGSGAGFPAVFLAFLNENCEFHLYEPIYKKSSFLSYIKASLNIKNIEIHSNKLEESSKFKADFISSRALMETKKLIEICDGFYDENTVFGLYKGQNAQNEIKDLDANIQIHPYSEFIKTRNYVILKGIKWQK